MCEVAVSGTAGWEARLQFDTHRFYYISSRAEGVGRCVRIADGKTILTIRLDAAYFTHPGDEVFDNVLGEGNEIICTHRAADNDQDLSVTFRKLAA